MEAWRIADLHAYVDDCLEPDERLAFEHEIAEDPALARRAAAWRAQNNAIRTAFDGEGARAFSISLVRTQNEPFGKVRRPAGAAGKPPPDPRAQPSSPPIADASRFSSEGVAPDAFRVSLSWRLGLAVLAVGLAFLWAPAATTFPASYFSSATNSLIVSGRTAFVAWISGAGAGAIVDGRIAGRLGIHAIADAIITFRRRHFVLVRHVHHNRTRFFFECTRIVTNYLEVGAND